MNKQKKLNLSIETYGGIPLSIIYKQIIRFMKENGIYTPYLQISLPQTKMSYETFLKNIASFYDKEATIERFFLKTFNVGIHYEWYGQYEKKSRYADSAVAFLNKINNKWMSYLSNFAKLYINESITHKLKTCGLVTKSMDYGRLGD